MRAARRCLSTISSLPPTIRQLLQRAGDAEVTVNGWTRTVRHQKRISFAEVIDGSTERGLQVVLKPDQAAQISSGCAVSLKGYLKSSPGSKQDKELVVSQVQYVGANDSSNPIQPKEHTAAFMRKHTHLRPRTEAFSRVLKLRDACSKGVSDYLHDNAFVRVEAPVLTQSDCEGGSSVFRVEASDAFARVASSSATAQANLHPAKQVFPQPTYLSVSAQLYLEALSSALGRVYSFGPIFRAERSATSRHLSEFWMLELEASFVTELDQVMDLVEGCCRKAWAVSQSEHAPVIEKQKWPRITYTEAVRLLQEEARASIQWGDDLSTEHERWLADTHFSSALFVTHYPQSRKPFYMRQSQSRSADRATVDCFDFLVPRIGEVAGGSLREERSQVLESAIACHGLEPAAYRWYADLRKYGSVPHGGLGLGWERLISWISEVENVRDCIAFPRAAEGFGI